MKIEKNIPMPAKTTLVGMPPSKYGTVMYEDMVTMEVGDSVRFDSKREATLACNAMERVKRKGHLPANAKFEQRPVVENGQEFVRVWRTVTD